MHVTINLPYVEYVGRGAKKIVGFPHKAVDRVIDKAVEKALYNVADAITKAKETS